MKKRLLTLCLAVLTLASALTGILVVIGAKEEAAFDADSYDYDALYIGQDALILNYSAMDRKAGDEVNTTLATAKGGQEFLLQAINEGMQTDWKYGNGYLEISTGSQLLASDLFTPSDAENPQKSYTVEYVFGTVDKGMPQSETAYEPKFKEYFWPGVVTVGSHSIGSVNFLSVYMKDEKLAELKALAAAYKACENNPALQEAFTFVPNPEHVGNDADGIFDYAQTKALIEAYPNIYYPLTTDYNKVGGSRVVKTIAKITDKWKSDYDWQDSYEEIFRMPFGEIRKLGFITTNTFSDTGYTEEIVLYKNTSIYGSKSTLSQAITADKYVDDLLLAKDMGARIYAVRVYDRALDSNEMQHNHVIDICRAYRLDPTFYAEADEIDRGIYRSGLSNIRIGIDTLETVESAIKDAGNSVLKTEKNIYTSLYVQDGLSFMISPMSTVKDIEDGAKVSSVTDLQGNFYSAGSLDTPATYQGRALNLGLLQTFKLTNVLPKEGSYSVRMIYANSQAELPSEETYAANQWGSGAKTADRTVDKLYIGPSRYFHFYVLPSMDPSAKSGITWSKFSIVNGQTGKYEWKSDFDTTWESNGARQPDALAIEYGQIAELTNEVTIDEKVTVTVICDGVSVTTKSNVAGDLISSDIVIGPGINTDLYALMVYTDILTEEEKMQNHFADLMAYYQVDVTMFQKITSDKVKMNLYAALSSIKIGETSREYLQGVLESYALTGGDLGVVKIADYITFEGIQSRIEDYASARALFSLNNQALADLEKRGCEVEIGTILMPVTENSGVEGMSLTYRPSLGEYFASDDNAILKTFYRKGESLEGLYGYEDDEKRYFTATIPALEKGGNADQQYYMRAYLAVEYAGNSFVLYADMNSEIFGTSVSIKEACNYFLFAGYAESEILASLVSPVTATAALKTQAVAALAHEKYSVAALASKLIGSARDGAAAAKKQNDTVSAGIAIDMSQIEAMSVGPLAASTKAQAELYATIGLEKYNVAKDDIVLAREAAETLGESVYKEALAAGADKVEAEEISALASSRLLEMVSDVEACVMESAPLAEEMQSILDYFGGYTALLQLSKIFQAKATVFVNGTTLIRYMIVTDNEHAAIAEKLQALLLEHLGNTVGVYNIDNPYVGSHFDYTSLNTIMLGITEAEVTADTLNYSIYGEGQCVYLEGSTLEAVEAAAAKFFATYCSGMGRQQVKLDRTKNALLAQAYTPLIAFNYANYSSYPTIQSAPFSAEGVWQVFQQKMQDLPDEITVIETVELEDIPDSLKNVYYVATDGDDANVGSIDKPFKTLEAALKAVVYCGGGTIYLRGGIYEFDDSVTLNASYSGTLTAPLYISAYPGENVTFTAAKSVDTASFKNVDQAIADGLIDASIKTRLDIFKKGNSANVYVTKLDSTKIPYGVPRAPSAYDKLNTQAHPDEVNQFYLDGQLMHVARWPNVGVNDPENYIENGRINLTDIGTVNDKGQDDVLRVGKVTSEASKLYDAYHTAEGTWMITFDDCLYRDHLLAYDKSVELYTYAALYQEYHRDHHRVFLSVDEEGRNIMEGETAAPLGVLEHVKNNMYFYNALEDLDENGEYFLDYKTGLLYVYSDTSMAGKELLASSVKMNLIRVTDASNVVLNGITFSNTIGIGINFSSDAERVIVQNCTFKDFRGSGVVLSGNYCGVLNSDFSNTSDAMIAVNSVYETLVPSHNFVQNCYFHDPNELQQIAVRMGGVGTVVSHNLIVDSIVSYNPSSETILEYNEFYRGSQNTYDSGPVYLRGNSGMHANHVRYNYIHDLNLSQYGIYLDDLCTSNYVYGNIVHYAEENSGGGKCINLHSANANVIYNNIGFNAETSGVLTNINYFVSSIDGVKTGGGSLGSYRWPSYSLQHLMKNGVDPEKYQNRFPIETEIANRVQKHIADRALNPMWNAGADKNSVTDASEIFLRSSFFNVYLDNVMINCGYEGYNIADPLKNGMDERNLYYATPEDAGIVDYENLNFNLREDSAVWKQNPSFSRVPFERMGRVQDLVNNAE